MSGGSMNHLYSKVLHNADFPLDTPERQAFAKHLKLVAQALHDIEWVDSGDYGPGDENAAIRACLRPMPLTDEEILDAVGWERAEVYMKLTPNFPVNEAKKETLKNARAIERAHKIGEEK